MKAVTTWLLHIQPQLNAAVQQGFDPRLIADFCDVTEASVARWANAKGQPNGAPFIRLWGLLELLTEMPLVYKDAYAAYVRQLYAFRCIELEEARDSFGLSGRPEHAYRYMRGEAVAKAPAMSLEELQELYRPADLEKAQRSWHERFGARLLSIDLENDNIPPKVGDVVPETDDSEDAPSTKTVEVVDEVPHVMLKITELLCAALPYVRFVTASYPPDQTKKWLDEYCGREASQMIAAFLERTDGSRTGRAKVPVCDTSGQSVAAMLRQIAPDIRALFEDPTPQGAAARDRLRDEVGQELYSNLTVWMTAMRSRRAYERATSGKVN